MKKILAVKDKRLRRTSILKYHPVKTSSKRHLLTPFMEIDWMYLDRIIS
ncbi:MAG: hypothetical protein WBI44_05680 [Syntrophaceticus sp.]